MMRREPIDRGEDTMETARETRSKTAEAEAARLKGQETRRRNYEKRMENSALQPLQQRSSV